MRKSSLQNISEKCIHEFHDETMPYQEALSFSKLSWAGQGAFTSGVGFSQHRD